MIHYDSLLQNATDIIIKCDKSLLQNVSSSFLLQNATVITKCNTFIKKWDSYYKMQSLMQIAKMHVFFEAKDQVILLLCYHYD